MFVYQAGYIIHQIFDTTHLRTWPPEVRHLSALGVFPATPVQLQWLGCLCWNGSEKMGKHGGKLGNNKEKTWKTQRDKQVVMFFILDLYRFINLNKFCGVKSPGKSVVCIMSSRWWWLEHEFYDFPFSRECHNPNWRTHIFQIYIIIYI